MILNLINSYFSYVESLSFPALLVDLLFLIALCVYLWSFIFRYFTSRFKKKDEGDKNDR